MSIPTATREQVARAMERFDNELRNTPAWSGWESRKQYKYAILEAGRRYPPKEIIAAATGASTSSFSGGEQSIRFLAGLGLHVEPLRLPTESDVQIALHELLLEQHPKPISAADAYSALADKFGLSQEMRS